MIKFDLLQAARDALGDVIGDFDDRRQIAEALRLRSDFETAIGSEYPQRSEILALLGRDPVGAMRLVDQLLKRAAA